MAQGYSGVVCIDVVIAVDSNSVPNVFDDGVSDGVVFVLLVLLVVVMSRP